MSTPSLKSKYHLLTLPVNNSSLRNDQLLCNLIKNENLYFHSFE